MNPRIRIAACLCLFIPAIAAADEPGIVFDCAEPALLDQRAVAAATDQHNFGQVYATRARWMAEARRACRRHHAARVQLVREATPPPRDDRQLARSGE